MSYRVKELLDIATVQLKNIADRPLQEAKILLGFHLDREMIWLLSHGDESVDDAQGFLDLVTRRANAEPIEYITGKVSFYSQEFYAAPGALIARPETEILIDRVIAEVPRDFSGHIVEVGVGSGIIAIILAEHLPQARVSAVDISKEALSVAKKNIQKYGLQDRIKLYEGDLLAPITEPIDLLVSNPPYIEAGVFLEKPLDFEPQNALFGGTIGDEILKRLIDEASSRKIPLVACEMGYDQKKPLGEYIQTHTGYDVEFYKDLADFDRGFVMRYKGEKNA